MELQRVWLRLSDKEYEARLAEFLQKNYQDTLELTKEAGPKTLLVTDAEGDRKEEEEPEKEWLGVVRLAVGGDVDPYQSGHEIAGAIRKAALEAEEEKKRQTDLRAMEDNENKSPLWMEALAEEAGEEEQQRKGRILSVAAASGGVGATLTAMAFSAVMGEYGRTLHLDMSFPSDWPLYFTAESVKGGLSELIYSYLAESAERLDERIEAFVISQPEGIFFLRPVKDPKDLHALTLEEAASFIHRLSSHFDHVVCDVGKGTDPFCRAVLRESDDVCVITDGSDVCEEKRKRFAPVTDRGRQWVLLRTEGTGSGRGALGRKRKNVRCDFELPWEEDAVEENEDRRENGRKGIKEGSAFLAVIREAVAAMG